MMITPNAGGATARPARRPERTCAACRRKASASELLRLVCDPDGGLVVDSRRNLPGRGAHLCPRAACLREAVARRALDRAFGVKVRYPEPEALVEAAAASYLRRLETLLRSGNGACALRIGSDAARAAVRAREASFLIVAMDLADEGAVLEAAAAAGIEARRLLTKEAIGRMLDRRPTGVIAVTDRGLAAAIAKAADGLEGLS